MERKIDSLVGLLVNGNLFNICTLLSGTTQIASREVAVVYVETV